MSPLARIRTTEYWRIGIGPTRGGPEWVTNMAIQKKSLIGAAGAKPKDADGGLIPGEPRSSEVKRLAVAKLAAAKLSTAKLRTLRKLG